MPPNLRDVRLTKFSTDSSEDFVELGQCFHLVPRAGRPKRFQSTFFGKDAILKTSDLFSAKAKLLCDHGIRCGLDPEARRSSQPRSH
jgi:hypothetical protein